MIIDIPSDVLDAIKSLNDNQYECYMVGGAVRDALLNIPIHDYDLTTNALPEEMKKVFQNQKTFDTGIQHGTITLLTKYHQVEITTYRKDAPYEDHRHPTSVIFTRTLKEDCMRRDFTINAFCYHPEEGLIDFFDGQEDLDNHIVRCIGNPKDRFDEDALRILRAIRFSSQLNFEIEEKTAEAIHKQKELLEFISGERIHEECMRLFSFQACAYLLDEFQDVFAIFMPEILNISPTDWEMTLQQLETSEDNPLLRFAILLGAPGIQEPNRILSRLKFSNKDAKCVLSLIHNQDLPLENKIDLRKAKHRLNDFFAEYIAYRKVVHPILDEKELDQLVCEIENDCTSLKQLAIDGKDAIALGFEGKGIQDALKDVLNQVMEEKLPNEKESIMHYLQDKTL